MCRRPAKGLNKGTRLCGVRGFSPRLLRQLILCGRTGRRSGVGAAGMRFRGKLLSATRLRFPQPRRVLAVLVPRSVDRMAERHKLPKQASHERMLDRLRSIRSFSFHSFANCVAQPQPRFQEKRKWDLVLAVAATSAAVRANFKRGQQFFPSHAPGGIPIP